MQSIKVGIFILCFISTFSQAENLNEKVARNAANCLTGHSATNSGAFQSGKTSEYIFLIENILGSSKARDVIQASNKKLNSAVHMLGSTKTVEGEFLINEFCPAIDNILANQK